MVDVYLLTPFLEELLMELASSPGWVSPCSFTLLSRAKTTVGGADQLRRRIEQDRAYVLALRDGGGPDDPRIGPSAKEGWEWVSDVHAVQLQQRAKKREHDGTSE